LGDLSKFHTFNLGSDCEDIKLSEAGPLVCITDNILCSSKCFPGITILFVPHLKKLTRILLSIFIVSQRSGLISSIKIHL